MSIKIKNLTKKFGEQIAVDNVSFEVATGEIVGFLGPNGAGKTTTMKMITSFLTQDEGEIEVCGIDVLSKPIDAKKKIGYLPENNPLYLDMFVIEYLEFVAGLYAIPQGEIDERIDSIISVTGLTAEKHKRISDLSKGYRQRVGLAQALLHDPEILILDEPTTGLDPNQIVEIRSLIRNLGKEKTVILSTHILSEVEATCDRVIIINDGRIVADSTPEELKHSFKSIESIRLSLISPSPEEKIIEGFSTIEGVNSCTYDSSGFFNIESSGGVETRKLIFSFAVEHKWIITELTPIETSLEDVFRGLTK